VDLIREADIHPKVVQTKTGPYEEAGVLLVAGGKGIYIAGGFAIPHSGLIREVRSVSLAEPNAKIPIWMAWRKDESAQGTRLFMQSMRIALKSHCATR
jgi:DNA-binding transcriptional LysR family regulator